MAIQSIGLREFRAHLHKYTKTSQDPLVITSHGETIGYFIPAQPTPQAQDLAALKAAVRQLAALLAASGVQADEIVADFQHARQHDLLS